MGMWINLTKNPMKPMIAKPTAVAMAIFMNSAREHNQPQRVSSSVDTKTLQREHG
jgi:hypothetical protein